jgi:hypothetical protein
LKGLLDEALGIGLDSDNEQEFNPFKNKTSNVYSNQSSALLKKQEFQNAAKTIFSSDVLTEGESPEKFDKDDEDASPVLLPYQSNIGFKKHLYDPHEPHSAAV